MTSLTKKFKSKLPNFFNQKYNLSGSLEGLNSSLAQSPDKL